MHDLPREMVCHGLRPVGSLDFGQVWALWQLSPLAGVDMSSGECRPCPRGELGGEIIEESRRVGRG